MIMMNIFNAFVVALGRRDKHEPVTDWEEEAYYWKEETHRLEVVIDELLAEIDVLQEVNENLKYLVFQDVNDSH